MSTREVLQRNPHVPMQRLRNLIALGRITPPKKNARGEYDWQPQDVEQLLAAAPDRRRRKPATPEAPAA